MKRLMSMVGAMAFVGAGAAMALSVGKAAPDFTGQGADGKTYHLADLKGKFVVLEWSNQNCPFVKKHYNTGNMQKLQKEWTAKGVVWLKVLSSKAGREGSVTPAQELEYSQKMNSPVTASLMDGSGDIGRAYDAKTTPHMFVIDPKGTIVYAGAIDDHNRPDPEEVKIAHNYVGAALAEATAGKPVSVPQTKPYGCGVKY